MEEKNLITSTYNKKTFRFISVLNVVYVIVAIANFSAAKISCDEDVQMWLLLVSSGVHGYKKPAIFDYGNFWAAWVFILICIANIIFTKAVIKSTLTVTSDRIYGTTTFKKRVDLPVDSISSIAKSIFSGLSVATSSGVIKFVAIKNRDEIYECLVKLLSIRQNKHSNTPNSVTFPPRSDVDELKKYKELLDNGIISQEEFDAKKKQLLGL